LKEWDDKGDDESRGKFGTVSGYDRYDDPIYVANERLTNMGKVAFKEEVEEKLKEINSNFNEHLHEIL